MKEMVDIHEIRVAWKVFQQNVGHEMKVASGRFRIAKEGAPLEPWDSSVELSATGCLESKSFHKFKSNWTTL